MAHDSEYSAPVEDLSFLLTEVLDCRRLFDLGEFRHADFDSIPSVLAEGARFAREVLAPINAPGDREGARLENGAVHTAPGFREAWARYVADGWPALDMPLALGGQQLPRVVQAAFAEMVDGACIAFGMLPVMCRAAARLLAEHAPEPIVQAYCPKLASGEWGATICISEAQAGSDVGRIRTLAVPVEGARYRLTGTKIFISYGDQDLTPQIAHLVLARTPGAPAGTRGISLFLVPKFRLDSTGSPGAHNGMRVQRLEHKMGLKASPTCVLHFEDSEALLIGEPHRGLNAMFTMVNVMRLAVAVQGAALAGVATQRALRYAAERRQGGDADRPAVPIIGHADVRRMLLLMRARSEAMRALVLEAALQLDLSSAASDSARRTEAAALAEWLLPICKAHATDSACELTQLAVQVFGGHGYVADAGVEQYARDGRVSAIYEGTNGIQALDLVTRKLAQGDGRRLRLFVERVRADLQASAAGAGLAEIRAALAANLERLERASAHLLAAGHDRPRDLAAAATPYLRLAGLVGGGWMWLRMAAAAARGGDAARAQRKQACARFYAEQLLPECMQLEAQILAGAATLDLLDAETLGAP